jgi:hypothetical protein
MRSEFFESFKAAGIDGYNKLEVQSLPHIVEDALFLLIRGRKGVLRPAADIFRDELKLKK